MAEISLWLDSYDDIYSDFDSRKYHKRRLSEDFIDELKAALKYRSEPTDKLWLLLPHESRNFEIETQIIASLKERFRLISDVFRKKKRKILRKGLLLVASGIITMLLYAMLTYKTDKSYFATVTRIIVEPATWFMVWTGLDAIFYDYKEARQETAFYETFRKFEISFRDL